MKKEGLFLFGWLYFILMFVLEAILPEQMGAENGLIENLQLLWLAAGIVCCYKMKSSAMRSWGGDKGSLCYAGMIYFFMLFMREISWGRALLHHPDGSSYEYSDMGLYGQLVHPLVGVLIVAMLIFCWRGRIWRFFKMISFPRRDFVLLLLFILMSWIGEKANFTGFNGALAEELAEFGAYMMMYRLTSSSLRQAVKKNLKK